MNEFEKRLNDVANAAASKIIEARDQARTSINADGDKILADIKKATAKATRFGNMEERQKALMDGLKDAQSQIEDMAKRLDILSGAADTASEFVGKTVKLKSGGPLMTASHIEDGMLVCYWADSGLMTSAPIASGALMLADVE